MDTLSIFISYFIVHTFGAEVKFKLRNLMRKLFFLLKNSNISTEESNLPADVFKRDLSVLWFMVVFSAWCNLCPLCPQVPVPHHGPAGRDAAHCGAALWVGLFFCPSHPFDPHRFTEQPGHCVLFPQELAETSSLSLSAPSCFKPTLTNYYTRACLSNVFIKLIWNFYFLSKMFGNKLQHSC